MLVSTCTTNVSPDEQSGCWAVCRRTNRGFPSVLGQSHAEQGQNGRARNLHRSRFSPRRTNITTALPLVSQSGRSLLALAGVQGVTRWSVSEIIL